MDTGISSAVGWINLTTLLLRRFASFGRATLHASVTRRAASYGFHPQLVSSPMAPPTDGRRGDERRSTWVPGDWTIPVEPMKSRCEHQGAAVGAGAAPLEPANTDALRHRCSSPACRRTRVSMPYTEKPDSGCVNRVNRGGFPRVPVPSRSRIGVRQRLPRHPPDEREAGLGSRARVGLSKKARSSTVEG